MNFWFKKRKKASAAAPMPKHPGEYAQDCNQSLLKDGRYDPTRVSSHENDVVKEVILASRKKYSRPYQGIGLAVETYSVIYKPRYILYEYIVQKYGYSSSVFDVLATAIAYKEKGAAYRRLSLQYFQLFFQSASSADIAKLPRSYPLWSIYNMMSDLYESTYDLESALDYAKKAAAEKRRLNFISPYDVTHTGKILLKMRPELAVDYFAECLNDSDLKQFKTIIQESLDDAKDKEKRGYIYKPRRKIIEPDQFDIEIQNLVRERYINL